MNIAESIVQRFLELQNTIVQAMPVFNKAFPVDDSTLIVSNIHPCEIETIVIAMGSFIKRLPTNFDDIEKLLPPNDFITLDSTLATLKNNIESLRFKTVSFYGENFEYNPARSGFVMTSPDGQRSEDLKGIFQNITTELNNLKISIRDIGPWLNKPYKGEFITAGVKLLQKERADYKYTKNELFKVQEAHKEKINSLEGLVTQVEAYNSSVKTSSEQAIGSLANIAKSEADAATTITNINKQKENLEALLAQENTIKDQLTKAIDDLNSFEEKLHNHDKSVDGYATKSSEMMAVLQQNLSQLENASREADRIIAKATSASLSGAYLNEANIRANSAKWNFGWVVTSLAAISCVGIYLVKSHTPELTIIDYIPRVLLIVPLSFIALVANTQLSVSRHAREEYSHKASLSLSFEGYRRLIDKDEVPLHNEFFRDTVAELRKNPADKLGKAENEIDTLSKVAKIFHKCPEILKTITENFYSNSRTVIAYNENSHPGRRKDDKASNQNVDTDSDTNAA